MTVTPVTTRIQGEKVVLRDLRPEDIEQIYYWKYLSPDREHLKWNSPYTPLPDYTLDEFRETEYRSHLDRTATEETRRRLVIEIDGEVKGGVGWYFVSEKTNWFEIGIVLYDSNYWSGGYGTAAFKMWMRYLFEHLDTPRLGIGTWSGNERMIGLAKKLGMIEEARVRKARVVHGEFYDAIKMGILREEWEALPAEGLKRGIAECAANV